MEELDPTEEAKVDNLAANIYEGLERTVVELQRTLPSTVDNMSGKQLRRALKAIISYPDINPDDAKNMSDSEQRFHASMLALHHSSVQLEIKVIGELQREHDNRQQQEKE